MTVTMLVLVLLLGLLIGVFSGMVGIGGGILVIPVLMFGFGFSQAKANGTSMAMLLPPIGVFAVLSYWRAGNIDWRFAGLLAAGFAAGAFVGAKLVNSGRVNPTALRMIFAVLLLYVAARILFPSGGRARAALETSLLVGGFMVTYAAMRLLGRRWERRRPDWRAAYRARRREPVVHDYEI
jgi:uncharacterized membrane protein YfcA